MSYQARATIAEVLDGEWPKFVSVDPVTGCWRWRSTYARSRRIYVPVEEVRRYIRHKVKAVNLRLCRKSNECLNPLHGR